MSSTSSLAKKNLPVIGFIGAGKMATALVGGLIQAGYPAEAIWVSCPTLGHLFLIKDLYGVNISQENVVAAAQADLLLLAVKPNKVIEVLASLREVICARKPLVLSVAAGITEAALHTAIGANEEIAVIRCMPNTPALVGQGVSVLCTRSAALPAKQQAEAIFQTVGTVLWIQDELQMSAVTALSGSGPAYFFILMEALESAGIALGLSQEITRQLVMQTALGSAHLAAQDTGTFSHLREQVTSKGGGTEQAMLRLESGQFALLMLEAVAAAKKRYDEM
jgi:pyrroline-5-carboxylate reductase